MNIYKEAMNALKKAGIIESEEIIELSNRRLLKSKYDMLQTLVDENEGIDCKVSATSSGTVLIHLVFDYFSTNRMTDIASIFDFAISIDVVKSDDERTEFVIEFPRGIT